MIILRHGGRGTMADEVTTEVLAAEEGRSAAIAAQDWTALDAILAPEFTYTHSTGKTEDKAAWTAGISGRRRAVEHGPLSVRAYGDVALLSGSSVYRYAEPFRGDSHYGSTLDVLQVWVRRPAAPGGWQIVAQHGVKLPPAGG
jgi:hypothetical protein